MDFATEGEASEVLLHWFGTEGPGRACNLSRLGVPSIDNAVGTQNADAVRWSARAMLAFAFGTSAALWAAIYLLFAVFIAAH
jgi:hypothetical protein